MFFFKNGAGEPLRHDADLLPVAIKHGVAVARDASFDHLQADELARGAALGLDRLQSRPSR